MADRDSGAAVRRRQRRLRQFMRHERMTVAMALAEMTQLSAPPRQTMARAGRGARDVLYGRVPEDALPKAAGAQYFAMDAREDVGEAPAAGRPAPLLEVLPQEQVQRCTVEQIVDLVLQVPMLQMVLPQMVEQLVDLLSPLEFPVPEQVIEVPKIVCPHRAARTVLGAPQTVEQLVEALAIVSLIDVIRQRVEQPVDIPVRAWGGTGGRLQGFLPGQSSSSSVEQIADIPVPHHGFCGGFQGFHPGQSTAASLEQIVDIHVPHGGPYLQDPGFSSLPQEVAGEAFQGVFSTFPWRQKSAKIGPELGADFTSSTSRAQLEGFFTDAAGVWMQFPGGWFSLRTLLEEFLVLRARAVRTWNLVRCFRCPCFWQSLFQASGCC